MSVLTTPSSRSLTVMPVAVAITFGLFYLMTTFIHITESSEAPVLPKTINIDAIFEKDPPIIDVLTPKPTKPPKAENPPAHSRTIANSNDSVTSRIFDPTGFLTTMDSPIQHLPTGVIGANGDGPAIPVTQPGAIYPERARTRGLEGYVDIVFDIAVDGSTQNVRVVSSQPAHTFDRAALRAVQKWRYRPERINGKPTPAKNIYTRVRFTMEK